MAEIFNIYKSLDRVKWDIQELAAARNFITLSLKGQEKGIKTGESWIHEEDHKILNN